MCWCVLWHTSSFVTSVPRTVHNSVGSSGTTLLHCRVTNPMPNEVSVTVLAFVIFHWNVSSEPRSCKGDISAHQVYADF